MTHKPLGEDPDSLLRRALDGIDLSPLETSIASQYPVVSDDEIATAKQDSTKASLLGAAATNLQHARELASGEAIRMPEHRGSGWSLTIDTPEGPVGLWSSVDEDRFYLGFPKDAHHLVPDGLLLQTLGVERAVPVITDSPHDLGTKRLWAPFYGPRLPEGGRVWIDYSDWDANGMTFPQLVGNGTPLELYYGHGNSISISTYPSHFCSPAAPDGPTTTRTAIQEYRERFILLAGRVAERLGGAHRIHIEYHKPIMVPQSLEREGYQTTWLQGDPGVRNGWGDDVVTGSRNGETVTLKSGNSYAPWLTIRRMDVPSSTRRPEQLAQFILEDVLYF